MSIEDESSNRGSEAVTPHVAQEGDRSLLQRWVPRATPKHDTALVKALFDDLSHWHEIKGKRVCYLSLHPMGESMRTITPKVRSIFTSVGVPPESLTVKNAEVHESHHGEVHIAMPAQLFDEYAQRMKEMLRDLRRAQGASGSSAVGGHR